jgi:hypothetical protein
MIRPCPTPGHYHPQDLDQPHPGARYVVRAYANHEDAEQDRPALRRYTDTAEEAERIADGADYPIVGRLALT